MERELWPVVYHPLRATAREVHQKYVRYHPWAIAAALLWAARHARPVAWACRAASWATTRLRPPDLPSAATVSRRAARTEFAAARDRVAARLRGGGPPAWQLLLDGKPLPVGRCSKDPDAQSGPQGRGYKLHVVWGDGCLPEAWEMTAARVYEGAAAERLLSRVRGKGILLADGNYEASRVYDAAAASGCQLLAPPDPQDRAASTATRVRTGLCGVGVVRQRAGVGVAAGAGGDRAAVRECGFARGRAGPAAELGAAAGTGGAVGVVQAGPQRRPHPLPIAGEATVAIGWQAPGYLLPPLPGLRTANYRLPLRATRLSSATGTSARAGGRGGRRRG